MEMLLFYKLNPPNFQFLFINGISGGHFFFLNFWFLGEKPEQKNSNCGLLRRWMCAFGETKNHDRAMLIWTNYIVKVRESVARSCDVIMTSSMLFNYLSWQEILGVNAFQGWMTACVGFYNFWYWFPGALIIMFKDGKYNLIWG